MKTDIVIDLSYGDCAKTKVTLDYLKRNKYDCVARVSGGSNCGHSTYHGGKKVVTHLIPCGIFKQTKSIIGPGCVVNVKKFFKEIDELTKLVTNCTDLIKISYNTHIVTEAHIEEEINESAVGTTRQGIGGAYRDKVARVGIRAESIPELKPFLIDFHEEIFSKPDYQILVEGAQGFGLDIDHCKVWKYCTSSSCTVAGALLNGIPHSSVREVVGVIKPYETYVGALDFEGNDPIFPKIREIAKEFGETTGRPRKINFLCIDDVLKAARINSINTLVVNKMDILQEIGVWKVRSAAGTITDLHTEENFKSFLAELFPNIEIIYSYSPKHI